MVRFLSVALATLMLAVACGDASPPADSPATIRVLISPRTSHAPTLIADAEGFFEEEGLDVELLTFDSGREAVALLLQGRLDVWGGTLNAGLANAFLAGDAVRVVADKGSLQAGGCTYYAVVARPEVVAEGPLDADTLRGKRVGFNGASTLNRYVGAKLLSRVGLAESEVDVVTGLDDTVALEAVLEGTLDVALLGEPRIHSAITRGAEVWLPAQEIVPGYPIGLLAFGPTIVDGDPDLGVRFLTAYLRGIQQYTDPASADRNLALLSEATGTEEAELREQCLPPIALDGEVDAAGLQGALDQAMEAGQLDGPVRAEDLVDLTFVRRAAERLAQRE